MNPADRLNLLAENNPFASCSARDPRECAFPDVPGINRHVHEGLLRLASGKATAPAEGLAALVLGEVGSGKTHLMHRLYEISWNSRAPYFFSYVQPVQDPQRAYGYLLRRIVADLSRPMKPGTKATPWHHLVGAVLGFAVCTRFVTPKTARFRKALQSDPLNIFRARLKPEVMHRIESAALDILRRDFPKPFARAVLGYRYPGRRVALLDWLSGLELDAGDAKTAGLAPRPSLPPEASEQVARDMLENIGKLLSKYGKPMLVCMDRLENLETEGQIHAFGRVVEFMVDTAQALLPAAFCRWELWEEVMAHKLNQHVSSRLAGNRFELHGATERQGLIIIRKRLARALGEEIGEDLLPLDRDSLLQALGPGYTSPRNVINLANRQLQRAVEERRSREAEPPPGTVEGETEVLDKAACVEQAFEAACANTGQRLDVLREALF
ncbi:MAG: hypothetical protein ACLFOY_18205 [Desulfatibacillaceae bacterium]